MEHVNEKQSVLSPIFAGLFLYFFVFWLVAPCSLYFPSFLALWAGWRFSPLFFGRNVCKEEPEAGFVAGLLTVFQKVQW